MRSAWSTQEDPYWKKRAQKAAMGANTPTIRKTALAPSTASTGRSA